MVPVLTSRLSSASGFFRRTKAYGSIGRRDIATRLFYYGDDVLRNVTISRQHLQLGSSVHISVYTYDSLLHTHGCKG